MNRLTVSSGAPLSKRVAVRVTDAEWFRLRERADALGMSVSDFVRVLIAAPIEFEDVGDEASGADEPSRAGEAVIPIGRLREATVEAAPGQPATRIAVSLGDLARMRMELSRWGNNLNQSAEALNAIARLGHKTGFLTKESRSEARYLMEQAEEHSATAKRAVEAISLKLSEVRNAEFFPVSMFVSVRKRA